MLTDWIHWISSLRSEELVVVLFGVLFVDGPRYALVQLAVFVWDFAADAYRRLRGIPSRASYDHCPSVCVILAGYNESDTIDATLRSIWGTYPRLEIIVVDDGSGDAMLSAARVFAADHCGVLVLHKRTRGGKSSCINFAMNYTRAEIIVIVDTDSHVAPAGLWEIVQPFADPRVGAVSATVLARNAFTNLITCFQAHEYLHSIFVGRIASARLGVLSVCSGAFGAFRRLAVEQAMGWDVGPGELRKSWYKTVLAVNYRLTFDISDKVVSFDEPLTAKVTFTDYLSGKVFKDQRVIKPR